MSKFVSRPSDRGDFQALTQSLLRRDSIEGPSHEAHQSGLLSRDDNGYASRPTSRAESLAASRPASVHRRNSEDEFTTPPPRPISHGSSPDSAEDSALLDDAENEGYGALDVAEQHARAPAPRPSKSKGVTFEPGVKSEGPNGEQYDTDDRQRRTSLHRESSFFPDDMAPIPSAAHHPKAGGMISPAEYAPRKLGTWDGVFMPVSLNILGIILFLRFGFIIGQVGLLGAFGLLILSYMIDTLTAMSLNAISTNGQVRGGGAYYLISRSLGPEFGGSIGLIFFAGQALNAAMNVLGFVESLTDAYGESRMRDGLPEGPTWLFFYGSLLLLLCMLVCLVGSRLFARATLGLAVILSAAIFSIPISSFAVHPFLDSERGAYFTGWSWSTFRANLLPHFTSGAAGSSTGDNPESWQSVFGVLFPAVNGILAGASMSGDLRKPSKSIPKGTNWSLVFTFIIYLGTFIVLASTVERKSFYLDAGIVNDIALNPQLITFGALASTAFSTLMGVLACAKVLQAIARDNLLPVLNIFAQGTEVSDTPIYAILITYVFCQLVLVVDSVNALAQLVTMTTLLTFGTLCFATAALKAGGAPSFRPSFRYWNIYTASGGTIISFGAMFFTDWWAALECLVLTFGLFVAVHIYAPPKPWGDVTRNLNYYISRRQMLRIDERKGHVKYWRPQVLLLANNPRTEWNTIIFCNSLKKGSLYVLGHVLKGGFTECLPELKRQNVAWLKLIDLTGIKSFVDIVIARDEREGARNLILSCGLGGMRPNIVVMGFPSHMQFPARIDTRQKARLVNGSDESEITIRGLASPLDEATDGDWPQGYTALDVDELPTDHARRETPIRAQAFVGIMEDTLALNKSIALAYGFSHLDTTATAGLHPRNGGGSWFSWGSSRGSSSTADSEDGQQRYLDLWPVQIASTEPGYDQSRAWDSYTMVLHLGTILSMTGAWKKHQLRVNVFVEAPEEVEEERHRIQSLLDNLRVRAELRVFCLRTAQVNAYEAIVLGFPASNRIERALESDPWWETLKELRKEDDRRARRAAQAAQAAKRKSGAPTGPDGHSPARRSKRQQQLLGFTLPPEHMAYFKRNIQIGLAHPKARHRRSSTSSTGSSGSSSSSSSSGSDSDSDGDLSDELYHLLDEEQWSPRSQSQFHVNGLRRAATMDHRRQKPKCRSVSMSVSGSTMAGPQGSPLADRIRRSLAQEARSFPPPPITSESESSVLGTSATSTHSNATVKQSRSRSPAWIDPGVESSFSGSGSRDNVQLSEPSDVESDAGRARTPSNPDSSPRYESGPTSSPNGYMSGTRSPWNQLISFNDLPNKAQYLILNELIRANSSVAGGTSVVLTALPPPEPGTAEDELRSLRYLKLLHALFAGGPPVLGVHAKTMTMTMTL